MYFFTFRRYRCWITIHSPSCPLHVVRKGGMGCQSLVFLARAHNSFTKQLTLYCAAHPNPLVSAWIGGPYGGINQLVEQLYDTVILAAGETGITVCLSWLNYLVKKGKVSRPECDGWEYVGAKRVVLIWVVREVDHFAWAQKEFGRSYRRRQRVRLR